MNDMVKAASRRSLIYTGGDLGAAWGPRATRFRLWAPTAEAVTLRLYRQGSGGAAHRTAAMRRGRNGTWTHAEPGDLHGLYYTVAARISGEDRAEAVDPYARAVGVNGGRGMVVNLRRTDPAGWSKDRRPACRGASDAIVYELHVRDFSIHPASGIRHKGRFLGLAEAGTRGPNRTRTGLDYLAALGPTHVQLLPIFDYCSVDENQPDVPQYNWGYDPQNYNAPEGSYATDPLDGATRIRELKTAIQALHARGIGVIMDVVYNHTGRTEDSNFHLLVPGYYHRQNPDGSFANGSACGNETASERPMMRRFMVESVCHWAREFHLDGFRFDLMGLHDIGAMKAIRAALDRIDPGILMYGEGWTGGASPLPERQRALKAHIARVPGVGAFSDDLRDGVKGPVFEDATPGFASGRAGLEDSVKFGLAGSVRHPQVDYAKVNYSRAPWARQPGQSVNYVSCHDNHTLWDKLKLTNPGDSEAARRCMSMMADAIVLTAQGLAFLHAGAEFLRTKRGEHNSYNRPDAINRIDWSRTARHRKVVHYYRGLIALRRAHPAFRLPTAALVRRHLRFLDTPPGTVAFTLSGYANGDSAETILVVHNARREAVELAIPRRAWNVLVESGAAGTKTLRTFTGDRVRVDALRSTVLAGG